MKVDITETNKKHTLSISNTERYPRGIMSLHSLTDEELGTLANKIEAYLQDKGVTPNTYGDADAWAKQMEEIFSPLLNPEDDTLPFAVQKDMSNRGRKP